MAVSSAWLSFAPLPLIGALLLAAMVTAAVCAYGLRSHFDRTAPAARDSSSQESYIVSAVLGLLALLLGFTYSLTIDRYETRRQLVLEEANAVGTAYMRAQLLGEPHRSRLSRLLVQYAANKIALANAMPGKGAALLKRNDGLITDLWAAEAAAFDSIRGIDFSSSSVEAMNNLIDLDSARKAARAAHVPDEVFGILLIYITVTAGVLGYVLTGFGGRISAVFLLALFTLSLLLVLDIDRPTMGGIRELQTPMEGVLADMRKQSPAVFDRYRSP